MKIVHLKKMIKENGLKQWQVAEFYGLNESNFSRLLRKDLPHNKEEKMLAAIEAARVEYGEKRKIEI
ncbi:XRE family transcriptional regulator [Lysinibacillus capsici]|uniref:XRE family transcriptional regulator n=1 Tax=Lysinibacillus capsici TaxID=2115968 RepID=UPI002E247677|nr:XRE family transcriptional regulator [Lysinibacillus capsici]